MLACCEEACSKHCENLISKHNLWQNFLRLSERNAQSNLEKSCFAFCVEVTTIKHRKPPRTGAQRTEVLHSLRGLVPIKPKHNAAWQVHTPKLLAFAAELAGSD